MPEQPNRWTALIDSMTPTRIANLERSDLPSAYQFADLQGMFEEIREDARTAAYLTANNLWNVAGIHPTNGEEQSEAVETALKRVEDFHVEPIGDDTTWNPNSEKTSLRAELAQQHAWLVKNARPFGGKRDRSVSDVTRALEADRNRLQEVVAEAQAALETIRTLAADKGAASAAVLYEDRAAAERASASNARKGLAVAGLLFVVGVVLLFDVARPDTSDTAKALVGIAGRSLVLATVAFGVAFFARDYRAHRHLEIVNRFKANALRATPLLREGIATDEDREVIVAELVRAVFAVPDTGFVSNQSDSMTIETPLSALIGGMRPSS